MLTNTTRMLLVGVMGLGFAGCATSDESVAGPEVVREGLQITTHDDARLEGVFRQGEAVIRFQAKAPAAERAELVFELGDKRFGYEALAVTAVRDGWFVVAADHVVDAADAAAAQGLLDALVPYLGHEATAMALFEASVPKMAAYLAAQPAGTFVASFRAGESYLDAPLSRTLNDDNRLCIKKTTTRTADYDRASGQTYAPSVVVGSDWGTSACGSGNYSCMGRCGAGCSGFGGGWTQDCLEHDACSHDLCASGGSGDANCGDEYNHASSDIFSSCSGN